MQRTSSASCACGMVREKCPNCGHVHPFRDNKSRAVCSFVKIVGVRVLMCDCRSLVRAGSTASDPPYGWSGGYGQ
jgi:hypothetical protein